MVGATAGRRTVLRHFVVGLVAVLAVAPFGVRAVPAPVIEVRRLRKWQCTNEECEPYRYDPSEGDLNVNDMDNPIPPGVPFEDLPDDWICPICNDPKKDFEPLDEWVEVEVTVAAGR